MLFKSFLLNFLFTFVLMADEMPLLKNPSQLALGYLHACALDDEGVKCWGENNMNQLNVPTLISPISISAGTYRTCALQKNSQVICWGYAAFDAEGINQPNVIQISLSGFSACSLSSAGSMKCIHQKQTMPNLSSVKKVATGVFVSCAMDKDTVNCWDQDKNYSYSDILNPTEVASGHSHFCFIEEKGVHCDGANKYGQSTVPTLKNPSMLALGEIHSCALDEDGVKCWGSEDLTKVPKLKNPQYISSGLYKTCAIDDEGVKCW